MTSTTTPLYQIGDPERDAALAAIEAVLVIADRTERVGVGLDSLRRVVTAANDRYYERGGAFTAEDLAHVRFSAYRAASEALVAGLDRLAATAASEADRLAQV